MKQVGLFFGTFNPFHNGHLFMANYCLNECDIDEVWIIVSPQNPLKKNLEILDIYERIKIIDKSISSKENIKVCLDELKLPKPNYTISTLRFLKKTYSKNKFIIIGENAPLKKSSFAFVIADHKATNETIGKYGIVNLAISIAASILSGVS